MKLNLAKEREKEAKEEIAKAETSVKHAFNNPSAQGGRTNASLLKRNTSSLNGSAQKDSVRFFLKEIEVFL